MNIIMVLIILKLVQGEFLFMKKMILILVSFIIILIGCGKVPITSVSDEKYITQGRETNRDKEESNSTKLSDIDIYILDKNSEYIIPIKTKLEPNPEIVIKYLIAYEPAFFSKETKLVSLKVEGNKAYVNLNKAYSEKTTSDLIRVANLDSIENTLCLNKVFLINEVQLLIEGQMQHMLRYLFLGLYP